MGLLFSSGLDGIPANTKNTLTVTTLLGCVQICYTTRSSFSATKETDTIANPTQTHLTICSDTGL